MFISVSEGLAINTLRDAAEQAEIEIFYPAEIVQGYHTQAVQGEYEIIEAFRLMLTGTQLAVFSDEQTGVFVIKKVAHLSDSQSNPKTTNPMNIDNKPKNNLFTRMLQGLTAIMIVGSANTVNSQEDDVLVLNPFVVQTSEDELYGAEEVSTGTIIAVDRDLIPFVTSVVTSDLIIDARIDNPANIAELISGVSKSTDPFIADEGGQSAVSFQVRGFSNAVLYNGFQAGQRLFSADSIGRIEVSKGPNAVLYGQAPGGGIINFITKRPNFDTAHATTSFGVGNLDYYRALFDVGGPIQSEGLGDIAFRMGGGWLEYTREQIYFDAALFNLWGSLSWRFNEIVTLDANAEFINLRSTPSRTAAFVSTGSGPNRVVDPFNRLRNDRNFSYNGPYSDNERDTFLSSAYLNFNLSESLTVRVGGYFSEQVRDSFTLGSTFGLGTNESSAGRYQSTTGDNEVLAFKVDVLHQTNIGGYKLRTLIGYEKHNTKSNGQTIRTPNRDENGNALYPVNIPFSRAPQVSDWPLPPAISALTDLRSLSRGETEWSNARITQFITSPEDNLSLMWGVALGDGDTLAENLRNDTVSTSEGDDTTYTIGATYNLYESDTFKMIAYANYATSFQIQSGNAQNPTDFDGFATVEELRDFTLGLPANAIDPQLGNGYEFGARFELPEQRITFSATYFDQTRENIARSFFVRESRVAGVDSENVIATFQLASGEENAKGVELAFDWRPLDNWTLTAEAQFTQGEVVSNPEAPEEEGFGLVRSPEDMLTLWTKYDFNDDSKLAGLSIGLGASYNSETRIRPQINDRFRLSDEYTNVRALIRYAFDAMGARHSLNLNITNLLDDDWTAEDNFLSNPRLYRFTYSIDW